MNGTTYRDAAITETEIEALRDILRELTSKDGWLADQRVQHLSSVIERWDANEATEFTA